MTLAAVEPKQRLMTTAELLAMPDDGIERWLIHGQLREGGMSRRNWRHSRYNADVVYVLSRWLREAPEVGGRVVCGEAGFQLTDDPDSTCGIDVAYVSRELADVTPEDARLVRGVPVLAVEILSPGDGQEAIQEKIDTYLAAGVRLVWIVEPVHKTVTAYRPDAEPDLFSLSDEITAEPHLPGFRATVRELFGMAAR